MPFFIIKGTFHVLGYSPDGDSVRFQADDETNWELLSGPPVTLNARRHAQLRLEAIDTLETHYRNLHQPLDLATRALDFLLQGLNITGVQWDVLRLRVTQANDGTEGYIISREVEPNRRPVSFAFPGPAPEADGSAVFLDTDRLRRSMNYQSVEAGLAYPTYYRGLFPDLRGALSEASGRAREGDLGVWAEDRTNAGFSVADITSITEEHVILPKLFRRLSEYLEVGGTIAGFKEFLEMKEDGVTIISTAHFTHLDNLVEVHGNVVSMTEPPENLVFEG
jgi:endonuclease YncB( thermonuclease family)